jgi:hypothetical protein
VFEARLASGRARNAHVDVPPASSGSCGPANRAGRWFRRECLPLPMTWALQSTAAVYAGSVSSRRP